MAKQDQSFDPKKVREFLKKSGFSIPKLELAVQGRLEEWEGMPALRVPGLDEVLVLGGGEKLETLTGRDLAGSEVRIEGLLHPPHEEKPSGMTVENFVLRQAGR